VWKVPSFSLRSIVSLATWLALAWFDLVYYLLST
jgi:hypothetical protein